MKRKILAFLTAAALCVGMLPSTVLADVGQPEEGTAAESVVTTSEMSGVTDDETDISAYEEFESAEEEIVVQGEEPVMSDVEEGSTDAEEPEAEEEPEAGEGDGFSEENFDIIDADAEAENAEDIEADGIETYDLIDESETDEPDESDETDEENEVKTITVDGITYTYEDFCLWIYDSSGGKVADYSFDPDSRTDTYGEDGEILSYAVVPEEGQSDWIENALTYTDPESGSTCHLIPVSYFEKNLTSDGYEFDEAEDCPLYYDAGTIVSYEADFEEEDFDITEVTEEGSYYSITVDEETSWYLRVQDNSTEFNPSRAAVYYVQPLAYEGEGSGRVVINLGNSNGLCAFADYSGYRTAAYATALRYTTEVLDSYADEDGSLTIYLPAEEDLNSTFKVVGGIDEDHPDISIALGNCAAYKYTLVGWVNIATGEYFDVSEGSVTADINLKNENVFYADWIAASYDHGSSDDPDVIETVSTSGFVTMHLYDFNEIFNMYSASLEQNVSDDKATITETWSDSGTMYDTLMGANVGGDKLTNSFIFVNDGASSASGNLGYVASQTARNKWTGTGGYPRNAYEQWGITSPSSAPLNILFDQSESYYGVHYVGEGDYLFQIDENGYYYFNSDKNTATYNQSDGRFYVYNGTQSVTNVNFPCFLPFNDYYSTLGALNGTVDYWFGMDMTVDFYLSNAVGRGGNLVNGEHMVFNFSGDDDIMIFIDGTMVLDMSGIHDEAFGSIDFTDGTVKLAMSEEGLESAEPTEFSLGAGNHQLQVYYMERGGRASNLEIEFNIMPVWDYESGAVQTVTAEKVWQSVDGSVITDMSNMSAVEVGLFDVVSAKTDETPGYTQSGDTYTFEYTDDKDVYHKYVYTVSSSGDTLVYSEGDSTVTYSNTNSDGKVVDDDGLVIAWLEDGKLHLRIDEQTLGIENDWFYAWELLDADGEYEALELSESSSYTTESASENLTTYQYWSIIGESEINSRVGSADDYPLILTEAAQEASGSIGNTKEAYGWVIVGTTDEVKTTQVRFSQIATMETRTNAETDTKTYHGVYGVTSQSEIGALGSGAVWYMEDAYREATDVGGEKTLEEFRLYCWLDGTKYYLALNQDEDSLMMSTQFGATFYYDALGELMVDITDDDGNSSSVRVEIQEDGTISIDVAEEEAALDDIRIYTLTETSTSGFAFTATNTLTYSFKLDKVETGKEDEVLEGATFSLYEDADCTQIIGFIATKDEDENIIYTVSDDPAAEGYTTVIEAGWVTIAGMSLDTFYLKELTAPSNDYVHLNEVIEVKITGNDDGSVTVTVDGAPTHVMADGDTIIVDNDPRGRTIIPVEKVWDDEDDQDGIRPGSITFHLFADGTEIDSATVTAADGWAYTFTNLPVYQSEDDGEDHDVAIVYTVTEDPIDGYTTEIEKTGEDTADGYTVTNTHIPATTEVTVTKRWDDDLLQQNRPDEITVQLYADGTACGDAVQLTESGGWTYTWKELPANSAGKAIAYTVEEADVTGYTPTYGEVTGSAEDGYEIAITNSLKSEKLSIQKVVSGNTDTSEFSFEITLKIGDNAYEGDVEVTYSDGPDGTLTFTDGTAEVTLQANETITLALPYGMTWEVTELTEGADTVVIYVNNEIVGSASGTITGDTPVRFVNSYRGFFPIDEEIVPDYTDRSTWVKDEAVNEYNAIEIEMSTILPVITGYELENGDYTMNFHEILDHELVLDEADSDFMVFIGGNQIDHQYYTITLASSSAEASDIQPYSTGGTIDDGCSFHVDVDLTALYIDGVITEDDLQGDTEIIIFFFADLEGTGLNGTYKSTVWYDIYDGEDLLYTSNVDEVYVYTYEIDILKYDASTLSGTDYEGSALAGATLGVYYDAACTDPVSRNGEAYAVTSGEDGKAVFYGLANGTYYVKEIEAPEGYVLSNTVITVVLGEELNDQGHAFSAVFANVPEEEEITPGPGPETGGDENPDTQTEPGPVITNPDSSNPDGSNPDTTGGTNTGDTNMTYLWILLMIAAAALVVAGVAFRTRPRVRR